MSKEALNGLLVVCAIEVHVFDPDALRWKSTFVAELAVAVRMTVPLTT